MQKMGTSATARMPWAERHSYSSCRPGTSFRVTKVPKENGGSRYAVLQNAPSEVGSRYARVLKDAFISVDLAKNILVIKTVSGMAMAAAAAFDEMNWSEIVGCIGGDDTIFCVARDDDAALVAAERLKRMVDGMEETGEEF